LVVRSGVMADESLRSWPKLGVEKISVFDSPLDSLGDLITR
jgi:hypothetical protein